MKIIKNKKSPGKKKTNIELGNLYDINKNIVEKNINPLTQEELQQKKNLVYNFMKESKSRYFMLLCHERRDYTVFNIINQDLENNVVNILIDECLKNRGKIKSIEKTKDNAAIEIWLSIDQESYCYYFFSYENGIIEC